MKFPIKDFLSKCDQIRRKLIAIDPRDWGAHRETGSSWLGFDMNIAYEGLFVNGGKFFESILLELSKSWVQKNCLVIL